MDAFSALRTMLDGIALGPNSAYDYAVSVCVFLGTLVALKILQVAVLSRMQRLARRTATELDDVVIGIVRKVRPPFYLLAALYFGIQPLVLPGYAAAVVRLGFIAALVFEAVRALERLTDHVVDRYFIDRDGDGNPDADAPMMNGIRTVVRIVLWSSGIAVALSNMGVDITSLIAGLGIGGIAVALALQNILGDVFSSFSIYLDKPFRVGDFIVIGSDMGEVEKIGLKSTRIRTLQGEQLVVSNKELTSVRVQNFKKMERRRVVMNLGIEYGTPKEKLVLVPGWIKQIIDKEKLATFDRCHFSAFSESSLDFETVFYVDTDDFSAAMDVRQAVNLAVYEKFAAEGIGFAYPTRTVHIIGGGRS